MSDAHVLVAVAAAFLVTVVVAVKVANDRGYDRGFKDGMWFRKVSECVSWETAMDALMEDCDD